MVDGIVFCFLPETATDVYPSDVKFYLHIYNIYICIYTCLLAVYGGLISPSPYIL